MPPTLAVRQVVQLCRLLCRLIAVPCGFSDLGRVVLGEEEFPSVDCPAEDGIYAYTVSRT